MKKTSGSTGYVKSVALDEVGDANAIMKAGGSVAWTESLMCSPTTCPNVAAGMLIHSQGLHVSAKWAAYAKNALREVIGCSYYRMSDPVPKAIVATFNGAPTTSGRAAACKALDLTAN